MVIWEPGISAIINGDLGLGKPRAPCIHHYNKKRIWKVLGSPPRGGGATPWLRFPPEFSSPPLLEGHPLTFGIPPEFFFPGGGIFLRKFAKICRILVKKGSKFQKIFPAGHNNTLPHCIRYPKNKIPTKFGSFMCAFVKKTPPWCGLPPWSGGVPPWRDTPWLFRVLETPEVDVGMKMIEMMLMRRYLIGH